jgi:hypothetical protein
MRNSLVHGVGDVSTLQEQITMLYRDRPLLKQLRETCIQERLNYTWMVAGCKLLDAYRAATEEHALIRSQIPRIAARTDVTVVD